MDLVFISNLSVALDGYHVHRRIDDWPCDLKIPGLGWVFLPSPRAKTGCPWFKRKLEFSWNAFPDVEIRAHSVRIPAMRRKELFYSQVI